MCYMLFLGSRNRLPTNPAPDWKGIDYDADDWFEKVPRLVVAELTEHNEKASCQFAEPTVVNAGSYEGCGSGFNYYANYTAKDLPSPDTDHAAAVAQESRAALAAFVEQYGVTTLFGCWAGDEAIPCESEIEISISQLRDANFALPERTRMTIRP